jgi:uncharacterized membrane protein
MRELITSTVVGGLFVVRPFAAPAFIIEELDDGRFTVFVPSVPTPIAGAVSVLSREPVHLRDVPFTQAVSSISRWGAGSSDLVAAMRKG